MNDLNRYESRRPVQVRRAISSVLAALGLALSSIALTGVAGAQNPKPQASSTQHSRYNHALADLTAARNLLSKGSLTDLERQASNMIGQAIDQVKQAAAAANVSTAKPMPSGIDVSKGDRLDNVNRLLTSARDYLAKYPEKSSAAVNPRDRAIQSIDDANRMINQADQKADQGEPKPGPNPQPNPKPQAGSTQHSRYDHAYSDLMAARNLLSQGTVTGHEQQAAGMVAQAIDQVKQAAAAANVSISRQLPPGIDVSKGDRLDNVNRLLVSAHDYLAKYPEKSAAAVNPRNRAIQSIDDANNHVRLAMQTARKTAPSSKT